MRGETCVVVGLGELHWDLLPGGRQPGGAAANTARQAATLGATGVVVSAVGEDSPGRALLRELSAWGIPTRHIQQDPAHRTGSATIALNAYGNPSYTVHDGAWDHVTFSDESATLVRQADAVCFGTLAFRKPRSRTCTQKLLENTMPGCLRVFDVNLRHNSYSLDLVEASLEHAEVLKLNEDELPIVTGLLNIAGSTKQRMEILLDRFALDAVALTRGARGSVLMTPDRLAVHHGVRVENVVDTVGAGDAYTAVLAMGLLEGWPVDEISERANQHAAQICTHAGATPTLPANMGAAS